MMWLLFAALMLAPLTAYAFGVDELIAQSKKDTWYVGKGITPGDYFVYLVCDNVHRFLQYGDHCYEIRLDFYSELISGNSDVWVAQAEITRADSVTHHIFLINSETMKIMTDHTGSGFADSIEGTVFSLVEFAHGKSPKHLRVGSTWGNVATSLNLDVTILVTSKEHAVIPSGDVIDAYVVRYGVFESSTFLVSPDMPFPIYAEAYNPGSAAVDPIVAFTVELIEHSGHTYLTNNPEPRDAKLPLEIDPQLSK